MSRTLLRVAICLVIASAPAFAATVAVGNCLPQYTSFSTITTAIGSVPAGSTIFVCPGSYPEQLYINKKLTIKGANNGTSGAAILTIPNGGAVQNTTDLFDSSPVAAQIVFDNVSAATVSFLTIDGTGNNITTCGLDLVGIYYRNSSGAISKNTVINQIQPPAYTGCQGGLGIFAESGGGGTSKVTISGNYVHNFQKNGITANGGGVSTLATISGNTVIGSGATTGAAQNSIQLAFGASGSITTNIVGDNIWAPDTVSDPGDAAAGILVYGSAGINVASNIVNSTQFGISVDTDSADGLSGDGNTIKANKISTTQIFDGVDLCSNSNTVTGNVITGSDESAIHFDDTCTGTSTANSASGNTITTACAAFLAGPGSSGNTIGTNTVYNVLNSSVVGTNSCTPPGLSALHRMKARAHAFRP